MLSFLKPFMPKSKLRSLAALQQFLADEAAYLAQRSVVEFVRNELGSLSAQAFGDPRFQAKMAVSRWDGFAAILGDMVGLAHAHLLAAGATRATLDAYFSDLYVTILTGHPPPDHRPQGWAPEIAALQTRLATRAVGPVNPQADATATGSMVFDTLPFVPRDPRESRMVLSNAFAFGLIAFNDRLRRLMVVKPIIEELSLVAAA